MVKNALGYSGLPKSILGIKFNSPNCLNENNEDSYVRGIDIYTNVKVRLIASVRIKVFPMHAGQGKFWTTPAWRGGGGGGSIPFPALTPNPALSKVFRWLGLWQSEPASRLRLQNCDASHAH